MKWKRKFISWVNKKYKVIDNKYIYLFSLDENCIEKKKIN